jgi:hypothetical protein
MRSSSIPLQPWTASPAPPQTAAQPCHTIILLLLLLPLLLLLV